MLFKIITAGKRSLGQGNKFTGICLSTGGVPDQVPPSPRPIYTPRPGTPEADTPPGTRYTPPEQTPPPDQIPLLDQVHPP